MIKGLLKRGSERGVGDFAEAGVDRGFAITSARLPGRSIIAFENAGGQAAALEVTDRGAEILRGLAAGAVVSELEDARTNSDGIAMPLIRDEGASREEAEDLIRSLELLDVLEKKELLGALPR